MWGSFSKVAGSFAAGETPTFAQQASRFSHQFWSDASTATLSSTALGGAGVGAAVGAVNGAVSYDGTFFGGAVNGAMLGGIGGAGIKGFSSVYSSGVRIAERQGNVVKDYKWSTFGEGLGFGNK